MIIQLDTVDFHNTNFTMFLSFVRNGEGLPWVDFWILQCAMLHCLPHPSSSELYSPTLWYFETISFGAFAPSVEKPLTCRKASNLLYFKAIRRSFSLQIVTSLIDWEQTLRNLSNRSR